MCRTLKGTQKLERTGRALFHDLQFLVTLRDLDSELIALDCSLKVCGRSKCGTTRTEMACTDDHWQKYHILNQSFTLKMSKVSNPQTSSIVIGGNVPLGTNQNDSVDHG